MKNILKCNFVICMLFIFIFSGCDVFKNIYYWGFTTSYRLPIYADKYWFEAMDEMFNKYPEMHITNEIVKIKKNEKLSDYFILKKKFYGITDSLSYTEKSGYRFPSYKEWVARADTMYPDSIDKNYIKDFFGKMREVTNGNKVDTIGAFQIVSNKKDIYIISFGYTDFTRKPSLYLLRVELLSEKYIYKYASDRSFSENSKFKKEFESEILPKILECIETVKQRHEKDE